MSLLAPLFIAGLGTLALPLIFHLIRRTPRGHYTFSSLMFVRPTPPRLTRRSRLDQILLLLLRAAALALLAMAFARPFFRQSWRINEQLPGRRTVFLLDTSASMRRGDLWQQAKDNIDEVLSEGATNDQMALYAFDEELHNIVSFAKEAQHQQTSRIKQAVDELYPGWSRTDLGGALSRLADDLDMTEDRIVPGAGTQIVLVSDLQRGADLSALESYEWPAGIALDIRRVGQDDDTNATVRLLKENISEMRGDRSPYRIRVSNVAGSSVEQFHLAWNSPQPSGEGKNVPIYVPAGQSRVVQLEAPDGQSVHEITLVGDSHDFDNRYYTVASESEEVRVTMISHDALDDPDGLSFYLSRALNDSGRLRYDVRLHSPDVELTDDALMQAVIVTDVLDEPAVESLTDYVHDGGTVLCVPRNVDSPPLVDADLGTG